MRFRDKRVEGRCRRHVQALFNPLAFQPDQPLSTVVLATVAPECAEADAPQHGDNGAHGVDCSVCYDKARAGTAIAGNLTGSVALVMARQVFCFSHWLDLARAVAATGAVSCRATRHPHPGADSATSAARCVLHTRRR